MFFIFFCFPSLQASDSATLNTILRSVPFDMPDIQAPQFPETRVTITDFGAVADGLTMNTKAIKEAITSCSDQGGGLVIIPAGIWLTGPIQLKSNINLHLEAGAVLLFSPHFEDYPVIHSTWEGQQAVRCIAPLSAFDAQNIAITGPGIIDGSGDAWRPVKRFKTTDAQWKNLISSGGVVDKGGKTWWPSEGALHGADLVAALDAKGETDPQKYKPAREHLRPVMVNLVRCENILLDGPTFQNSPAWNIHPLMCRNMIIRNISVRNPWYSQNGDGIDLESCRNVVLYDATFDVGDDAICLKSGKNAYGRERGIPSENIIVDHCTVYHGHGGFTVGSEMSGGICNISVSNCTFLGTDVGLRFKSTRGRGGVVENIFVHDIYMKDIPAEAIRFNMFYENKPPLDDDGNAFAGDYKEEEAISVSEETPVFRNIQIDNIVCCGAGQAVYLQGLPEMSLKDIRLNQISISANKGLVCIDGEGVRIENVKIIAREGPQFSFFNSRKVSIHGIYNTGNDEPFIVLRGTQTRQIDIETDDYQEFVKRVIIGKEVPEGALIH